MIKSDKFNDVYFSADGGVDETHHVFLAGNDLPNRWQGQPTFTIAELGFGTGLNLLCAWKLFEETSEPEQRLDFVSVEKYPLSKAQIREALLQWNDYFGDRLDRFLDVYPLRIPGPHKIYVTDKVTLTLWIGDVADVMPEWNMQVDAWFLDGFTPSKNADMWSDSVFQNMARLSDEQTTYATFTAAGDVRRGLDKCGFSVETVKGFGNKRDMIQGVYQSGMPKVKRSVPKKIAIIGGGLAGCALAYLCHKRGIQVVIYEAGDSLASGASGGRLGMINPQLMAKSSPQATYYGSAYAHALRVYAEMDDVDFNIHGSTYLCLDDDKDRRFKGYIENLGWHGDHIHREGMDLHYPDGASVSPRKLCHAMAQHAQVHLNTPVENFDDINADDVILANGYSMASLLNEDLFIYPIRGQVSWVKPMDNLNKNMCFGGYITPRTTEEFHVLGSTFERHETSVDVRDQGHQDNISRYNDTSQGLPLTMDDVVGGWVGVRTATKGNFPIVGELIPRVYISTAHGSHGIVSSIMGAEIILAQLTGDVIPASRDVLKALSPKRFHRH
jgi:tRNA 5-methylaminomethyl-2-thiouridine biosynthesis bifunctional protein